MKYVLQNYRTILSFLSRRKILFSKRYFISKLFSYLRIESFLFIIHIKIKYSRYNY